MVNPRKQGSIKLIRKNGKLRLLKRKKSQKFSRNPDYSKINWDKVDKILSADREMLLARLEKERINSTRTKALLRLLAAGAVIGMSFVIPTLPLALAPFIVNRRNHHIPRFSQTIGRLKQQKLVEIVYEGDETLVRISKEGKLRALRYKLDEMKIIPQKKWDKQWRMVIFDIPEKYKRMRDIFRQHLKTLGFYQLQKSVWVHVYPCMDEIEFLREIYHVGFDVCYVIAKQIEDDSLLKSHFDLNI